MWERVVAAQTFLAHNEKDGSELLEQVVTGDELWIHRLTPKMKASSSLWKTKNEPLLRKFKMECSAGKVMMAFWGCRGLIYVELGTDASRTRMAIMKAIYFNTSLCTHNAIKERRHGLLLRTVFVLHNNARSHRTKLIKNLITDFKWEKFTNPYSLDLAPSDYHLSPWLKKELGRECFSKWEKLIQRVNSILKNLGEKFYRMGIEELATRYQKCLDRNGDYVEK